MSGTTRAMGMTPGKQGKQREKKRFAAGAGFLAAFFSLLAMPVIPAGAATSADTFEILVSRTQADLIKTKPGMFGSAAMDSLPLLEFRDIRFLRFDPIRHVEVAFEFMPDVFERLRPRLTRLHMCSFVLLLKGVPVYSGIVVPHDLSVDYLKKSHYAGPVIFLPATVVDSDRIAGLRLSYFSEDGIYRRSDDPRGNQAMIDAFTKANKFILTKGKK